MGRLDGKVALISGGAKGQGAAETRLFVREGAKVVFGDILDDDGKKVEAEIRGAGGEVTYVHLNVKGVFLGTKCALAAMRQAGGGSIINISSTAGLVGSPGETAAYTATKGAVRLFTKATAVQHAKENIRCNSVHPGPIATDMIKDMLENRAAWEQRLRRLPMGRVGTADDVGYGVLYLASDESSYVTGSELVIDGGTTAE
jgi:NAD(P)-dependent dehydrogenase (short-subunit alcohol dehydrogenase family)